VTGHLENPENSGKSNHTDEDERLEILLVSRDHEADVERKNGCKIYPIDDGFPKFLLVRTTGEPCDKLNREPNDADYFDTKENLLVEVWHPPEKRLVRKSHGKS
jgi:hypothetical protein